MIALVEPTTSSPEQTATLNEPAEKLVQAVLTQAGYNGANVRVTAELLPDIKSGNTLQNESFTVTVAHPMMRVQPAKIAQALKDGLRQVPLLAESAQWDTPSVQMKKLRDMLQDLRSKGADFPEQLLQWRGFSKDFVDKSSWDGINDYALEITKCSWGDHVGSVQANLNVPLTKEEAASSKAVLDKVANDITASIDKTKETLVARLSKYKGIAYKGPGAADASPQEAEIRAKVAALKFEVVASPNASVEPEITAHTEQVTITISAPDSDEMKAIRQKMKDENRTELTTEERAKFEAANFLNELESDKLAKAVGRSILYPGEQLSPIFAQVAGRKDMIGAIGKSVARLKTTPAAAADPGLVAEADAVLNHDAFKTHGWRFSSDDTQDKPKPSAVVTTDKDGNLKLTVDLEPEKPGAIIQQMNQIGTQVSQAQALAATEAAAWSGRVPAPGSETTLQPAQTSTENSSWLSNVSSSVTNLLGMGSNKTQTR